MKSHLFIQYVCVLCTSLLLGFMCSCTNNFEAESYERYSRNALQSRAVSSDEYLEECEEGTEIVLGEQLQNPYEITNMRNAYALITRKGLFTGAANIPSAPTVNMYYYRVLPASSEELDIIVENEDIYYTTVPYDYQIDEWCGDYYMDPDCPDSLTWLYAVVPANYGFPEVGEVEVLADLYIPEEVENVPEGKIDGVGLLEYVAYKLTGNLSEWENEDIIYYESILSNSSSSNIVAQSQKAKGRWLAKSYPTGTISVHNTTTGNYDGIDGVQIIINNLVKICSCVLDENGQYTSVTPFRTKVWYTIRFYNTQTKTSILPKVPLYGSALYFFGRHSKTGYNAQIEYSSKVWRHATINNTLVKNMAFNEEYGIQNPEYLRIWVLPGDDEWSGSTPMLHWSNGLYGSYSSLLLFPFELATLSPITPDMLIFANVNETGLTTGILSKTLYHELAHASHYLQVGDEYWDRYISHIIWNLGYGDSKNSSMYAGYCGIGEMWATYVGYFYHAKDTGEQDLGSIEIPDERCRKWYKPCSMVEVGNKIYDSDVTIGNMYQALEPDIHDLETLKDNLYKLGVPFDIIDEVFTPENEWD